MAKYHSLTVHVIVAAHDSFGDPATRTLTVTLHQAKARKPAKKKHH